MRFSRALILSGISAAVFLAGSAALTPSAAQTHSTGLTLLRPDELAKIPPAFTPFGGGDMPRHVDLSPLLPPPGNQGQQSSCVAWATAYALRSYQAHVRERAPLVHADGTLDSLRVFSPAFVYNQINNGRDAGSAFPDALDLLKLKGAAPLGLMPYSQNDYTSLPNANATNAAARYRIAFWRQINVNDTIDIKSQLNAGYPVVIGATVDEGFDRGGKGFVWNHIEGRQLGGHAMVIVGYDDDRGAFRVQNSWGRDWGDGGYYWLDYGFFGRVVNEAYVAKDDLSPITPPTPTPTPVTPTPVVPTPVTPPSADVFDHSTVSIVRVQENVVDAQTGPGMRFDGIVAIPPGAQGELQVVVQLYYDAGGGKKGHYVEAAQQRYSVAKVRAATGTKPFPLTAEGGHKAWYAFLPYSALKLTEGSNPTPLVAEPVLYVDRFGVKGGPKRLIKCACGR